MDLHHELLQQVINMLEVHHHQTQTDQIYEALTSAAVYQ